MILGNDSVFVGIGLSNDISINNGPNNKLEIDAGVSGFNPSPNGGPGTSGLRLRDMHFGNTTVTNPGTGVLSVDTNGDVIYVQDNTGFPFGGICGNANTMQNDFEIPMNNKNFIWSGQGTTGNNIGIGMTAAGCAPLAKLQVRQNSTTANSIGILSETNDMDGIAVKAFSGGNASASQTKVAGWFESTPSAGTTQVAIFVPTNGGQVIINRPYPYVTSNTVDVGGTIFASGTITSSDASLKHNVNPLTNSLNQIKRLRPVTFEWNTVADSGMAGIHSGFIAQEVDTVIPSVVHTDASSLKSIAYAELIPYLVKAIQQQQNQIDSLSSQLNSCCSNNSRTQNPNSNTPTTNQIDLTLNNSQNIVLNQNVPNPFAEQTTITFNLPESIQKAQILFYDVSGKMIKAVDVATRGSGQLNVFADDLSNGIYTYTLVADGQIIDTKKMIKTK